MAEHNRSHSSGSFSGSTSDAGVTIYSTRKNPNNNKTMKQKKITTVVTTTESENTRSAAVGDGGTDVDAVSNSIQDERWCTNGDNRIGEYGVIGAEQADESHFDDRSSSDEEDGDDHHHRYHHQEGMGVNETKLMSDDDDGDGDGDDQYNVDASLSTSDRSEISFLRQYKNQIIGGSSRRRKRSSLVRKTKKKLDEPISAGHQSADGRIKFSKRKSYGRQNEIVSLVTMYRSNCEYVRQFRGEEEHQQRQDGTNVAEEQHVDAETNVPPKEGIIPEKTQKADNKTSNDHKEIHPESNDPSESSYETNGRDDTSSVQIPARTPCSAFISGFSGCGKSTLVDEFVQQIRYKDHNNKKIKKQYNNDVNSDDDDDDDSQHRHDTTSSCSRLLFLKAKYTQQRRNGKGRTSIITTPFGALGGLFDHIKDDETRHQLKQQLSTTFKDSIDSDDMKILTRIFPGLTNFLNTTDCTGSSISDSFTGGVSGPFSTSSPGLSSEQDSEHRSVSGSSELTSLRSSNKKKLNKAQVEFVLQSFFELLSSDPECPLILFLDDLQWADFQSLSFLTKLLTNTKLTGLFFVGAYRSNEVNSEHALTKVIEDIQKQKESGPSEVPLLRIDLNELSMDDIGQFIADTLRLDPDQVETLTQAVYTKTLGNPFFTRQALEQLVRKNVLYYDTITFEWNWNLSSKQELEQIISDDIEEMVKNKLENLSTELQQVLVVSSCISHGGVFDVDTLLEVLHAAQLPTVATSPSSNRRLSRIHLTRIDLLKLLDEGVSEGLLLKLSKTDKDLYSFSHDRIEDAAQSFMNEIYQKDDNEYQKLLFKIGTCLYSRAQSAQGEDWMYFSAAHRLNSLRSSVSSLHNSQSGSARFVPLSRQQEIQLAELNQRTAELSLELLAFHAAAEFCQFGIQDLLGDRDSDDLIWKEHYELILSLYTVGAESEYSAGNIEGALDYCEKVLRQQPHTIYDFLPIYKVKLDSLSGKDKGTDEVFELTFWLCKELGFKFPQSKLHQKMAAWSALRNTRARYIPTEESIRDMPFVEDPLLTETFDMLMTAGSVAFQVTNINLYVLVICEGLKWMNRHGLTDGSAAAIASFANALMHVYGDFETSAKLADLSIQLTNRSRKKFSESRPLNTAGMFVLGWVRPIRSVLPLHIRAQEAALASGNIDGVGVSKSWISWNMMYSSMPLSKLEAFCRKGVKQLRSMKLMWDSSLVSMTWQASLNLLGKADNVTVMTGEAMDESAVPFSSAPFCHVVNAWKRYLYVFFNEWEIGANHALEAGDGFESMGVRGLMYGMETFVRGMLLFGMARKCNLVKYKKPAFLILQQLREWVKKKGCVNLAGPTKLLKAEMYVMTKNQRAQAKFEQAIALCLEGKFQQYAGLANERFALYLGEIGQTKEAREHTMQAVECYRRWGATEKVNQLMMQLKNEAIVSGEISDGEEAAP